MLPYILGALAVGTVFSALAGALYLLGRLEDRRLKQAKESEPYHRAVAVQVLAGSPVARNRGVSDG